MGSSIISESSAALIACLRCLGLICAWYVHINGTLGVTVLGSVWSFSSRYLLLRLNGTFWRALRTNLYG